MTPESSPQPPAPSKEDQAASPSVTFWNRGRRKLAGLTPPLKPHSSMGCVILLLVMAMGGFALKSMIAEFNGDVAASRHYRLACQVLLAVYLSIQATVFAFNPTRVKLALFLMTGVLVLVLTVICQIFRL